MIRGHSKVLAMHLDEIVGDRFLRFDEEARHEGTSLGGRKTLQIFRSRVVWMSGPND
jgi:hypothetical protein